MKRAIAGFLSVVAALTLASFLPIIPILQAPVAPHASWSLRFRPALAIFNPFIVGVAYQARSYTLVCLLLLLAVAVVLGLWVGKMISSRKPRS